MMGLYAPVQHIASAAVASRATAGGGTDLIAVASWLRLWHCDIRIEVVHAPAVQTSDDREFYDDKRSARRTLRAIRRLA